MDKLIIKPKVVPRTTFPTEGTAQTAPRPAAQEPPTGVRPARTNPVGAENSGRGTPSGAAEAGAKGAAQGSISGSLDGSTAASALIGLYGEKVREAVQREWRLINDQSMAGLKAVVEVQIRKNGELVSIQVVKPSGNAIFDDAAKRAVLNAAPLPAVPEVILQPSTKLILTFLPGSIS